MEAFDESVKEMHQYIGWGVGAAFTIGLFLVQRGQIVSEIAEKGTEGLLSIVLLALSIWWFVTWFLFGDREVVLLHDFSRVDLRLPRNSSLHLLFPIVLGVIFGGMISSVFNLLYYILLAILVNTVSLIGDSRATHLMAKDFYEPFPELEVQESPEERRAQLVKSILLIRTEIFKYYFQSYYFARYAIAVPLFVAASVLLRGVPDIGLSSSVRLAYLVTIIAVLANEIPLTVMRKARNRRIAEIDSNYGTAYDERPSLISLRKMTNLNAKASSSNEAK